MEQPSFAFGQNWLDFLKNVNDERIKIAEASLLDFMGVADLSGRAFLDIGCGSGLFSLAAHNLGAKNILSFDVDPQSVQCCESLRRLAGAPENWIVTSGSVLDREFMNRLDLFDIVYSWGVLHHTGKMWEAIENAAKKTSAEGYLYIALYNKLLTRNNDQSRIHDFWIRVKKLYNGAPAVGKYILEPLAMSAYIAMVTARGENPISHIRNYKSHRGMSWKTDAVDWLGGWPYEFATVEEVFRFMKSTFPAFTLENLKISGGRGLNWYLFKNG